MHIFLIGNSVAYSSAWDFGQKLSPSLATAQPQIGLFLSKQLIFLLIQVKINYKTKQLQAQIKNRVAYKKMCNSISSYARFF